MITQAKAMAPRFSTLAWKISWMEEPGRLQSMITQENNIFLLKGMFFLKLKECSNYHTIALISHASKIMLKILQARFQQYVNHELPDVQADFRKGRGTRDQLANIHWIMEKAREFQKNIYFFFIDLPKPLTVWITINCGKF